MLPFAAILQSKLITPVCLSLCTNRCDRFYGCRFLVHAGSVCARVPSAHGTKFTLYGNVETVWTHFPTYGTATRRLVASMNRFLSAVLVSMYHTRLSFDNRMFSHSLSRALLWFVSIFFFVPICVSLLVPYLLCTHLTRFLFPRYSPTSQRRWSITSCMHTTRPTVTR